MLTFLFPGIQNSSEFHTRFASSRYRTSFHVHVTMSTVEHQPPEDIAPVPCDGCGLTFPLRQAEGDCPKCVKLALHEIGSPDYNELRVRPILFSLSTSINPQN